MNRGRMGEVKTHRVGSQGDEKETEQESPAIWTREDRTKGGKGQEKERRTGREGTDSRKGTYFSAVGEAKFRWGIKVLSEANTKRG